MKKKIQSILAKTQLHKIEAESLAKAEESLAKTEEIETEPLASTEIETIPEPDNIEEKELEVSEPKYTLHQSLISWDGDIIQKNKIFDRCAQNGIITKKDATGLEEKSIILDSIIPKIIVDESVASSELIEKLKKQGYDGMYLGEGHPDEEIFRVTGGKNTVLVIEEKEFYEKIHDNKVYHVPIFIERNADMVNYNVGKIVAHMQLFEKIIKYQS